MTINEIKKKLGIDLKEKSRKPVHVVLKAVYVEQQYFYFSHLSNPVLLKKICKDLGCDRTTVLNLIKKLDGYKKDPATKLITKAYYHEDKTYIDKYYEHLRQAKIDYRNQFKQQDYVSAPVVKVKVIPVKPKVSKLMTNLQVADFLKANNILKSVFWDKNLKNYTAEDWEKLREINPESFDNFKK